MRGIKIKVIGMMLSVCIILSGCGEWKNYIHTDASLKREAAKALENKYEEEFVIHSVWVASQTTFCVTCSPEDDRDVVFQAEIYKDGRGVLEDEYLQGAVANQIRERLTNKLQEVFKDYYVIVTFTFVNSKYDYDKDIGIENYYELYPDASFYLRIFVNEEGLMYKEETVEKEFECLSNLLDNEIMQNAGCSCFFVDELRLDESIKYFQKDNQGRGTAYSVLVEDAIEFEFGFNDGKINRGFEEYVEIRKEIGANE